MFTEKEKLLANEAHLTKSLLSTGLHALRKADVEHIGLFYQAFFSLSIGLERMLKIIMIMKFRVENDGRFPENHELIKCGHDLKKLLKVIGIVSFNDEISNDIISFLNAFADKDRYYNFDSLTISDYNKDNPLVKWKQIQNKILETYPRKTILNQYLYAAKVLDQCSCVYFDDLSGNSIDSVEHLVLNQHDCEYAQSYAVWHLFKIIKTLKSYICSLEREKHFMPVISEFFDYYTDYWSRSEIRKKKNWMDI